MLNLFKGYLTALHRKHLSRPVALALDDGLIHTQTTVFDYGCGWGGDVKRLRAKRVDCVGWDPFYQKDTPKTIREIVNLGYVVNVIDDPQERLETLREAWSLASKLLIVSAQLNVDNKLRGAKSCGDGFVTSIQTFQKFYDQSELRAWIEDGLGDVRAVPAAPGIFYVFKDELLRQEFLASRYRRRAVALPTPRQSDVLFDKHQELLRGLMEFFASRGRLPELDELLDASQIVDVFGSLPRAFHVVRLVTGSEQWEGIKESFAEDLLVYVALARFEPGGRPKLSQLPDATQRDIRALFGTYTKACEFADAVLFALGDTGLIDELCRQSPVGKLTGSALYVHKSALDRLPAALRVFEGCARSFLGEVEGANLVKLHRGAPKVSYLSYPDFDKEPHPELRASVLVHLRTFKADWRDYSESDNPPLLHRKEEFVADDYNGVEKFRRLTKQEEKWELYEDPSRIGTRNGWEETLSRKGVELKGHRVVVRK